MCKNMMIAGIKPEKTTDLWKFMIAAKDYMTAFERDGLGYAAQGSQGTWGERWLSPHDAWKLRTNYEDLPEKIRKKLKDPSSFMAKRYNTFGPVNSDNVHAVIYHSRLSTNTVNLFNVHPFVRENTALIHNGVISNHDKLTKLYSSCDSEVILNEYFEKNVTADPSKIEDVTKLLEGYYACGVLSQDTNGNQFLDIFRNPSAPLHCAYIPELDAVVYCTSNYIIENTCKDLGWTVGTMYKLTDEVMLRINAKTGELISKHKFKASYTFRNNYHGNNGNWNRNTQSYEPEDKKKVSEQIVKDIMLMTHTTRKKSKAVGKECGQEEIEERRSNIIDMRFPMCTYRRDH